MHLIEPLGFALDERHLRRAGLDYREWVDIRVHPSLEAFEGDAGPARILAFSSRAARCYSNAEYQAGDALLFGSETSGLPAEVRESVPEPLRLKIPMQPDNRSLNLSNAVAVVCYEAWRQHGFSGAG